MKFPAMPWSKRWAEVMSESTQSKGGKAWSYLILRTPLCLLKEKTSKATNFHSTRKSRKGTGWNFFCWFLYHSRHRHKTSNSPELLEFMKYDPFLIFWWIFCRNLWKIEYENEVCFEACRMLNFFRLFYDSLKK